MSELEKAAAAAVASWERDGANYRDFCQQMDALREALAAHRQAEPVAEPMRTCSLCEIQREDACEILNCGLRDWGKR